jgi:hypothetical protein
VLAKHDLVEVDPNGIIALHVAARESDQVPRDGVDLLFVGDLGRVLEQAGDVARKRDPVIDFADELRLRLVAQISFA